MCIKLLKIKKQTEKVTKAIQNDERFDLFKITKAVAILLYK